LHPLIHINIKKSQLVLFVDSRIGNGSEVDIAQFRVDLAQVLDAFRDFLSRKGIAVFDWEQGAQRSCIGTAWLFLK
jgi:hypothetical protein